MRVAYNKWETTMASAGVQQFKKEAGQKASLLRTITFYGFTGTRSFPQLHVPGF
jgi:hypothetical protein